MMKTKMLGNITTSPSKSGCAQASRKHETSRKYLSDENSAITFRHWRVLQAVYDYGGLTEAAAHLHVTPPTVSYSMQSLEKLLGVKLYNVKGKKIAFTMAGILLVQRSRTLLRNAIALEAGELASSVPVPPAMPMCPPNTDQ